MLWKVKERRKGKGTVLFEFLLILPFFFFFLALVFDVSRLMFFQNAAQDAAFAAARAGAQIGSGSGSLAEEKAQEAFEASVVARLGWAEAMEMDPIDQCDSDPLDPYYQVRVNYDLNLVFPQIIGMNSTVSSSADALSRCEIVRS